MKKLGDYEVADLPWRFNRWIWEPSYKTPWRGEKPPEGPDAQLVFVILHCTGKDVIKKGRKCALFPGQVRPAG